MEPVESSEEILSLTKDASLGTLINDEVATQLYWKRQVSIVSCDPNDAEKITSIRVRGQKLFKVNAGGVLSKLKGLASTAIDPDDNFKIYIAPTRYDQAKLTFAGCKKKFAHTVELGGKLRIAVIYSEDEGIDGVDLGIYSAVAYTEGNGNFLVLERDETGTTMTEDIPKPQSVGNPVVYKDVIYRSQMEGRVAVLLDALDIPYLDESKLEQVSDTDGHKYHIDFLIYPDDAKHVAYLEVKPFRPIREEVMKAVAVHRNTNVPVFLMWGKHFVQGIGMWNDKHCKGGGFHDVRKYEDGIRAMKIFTNADGFVVCDEGYYFMTNNTATGEMWVEDDPSEENKNADKAASRVFDVANVSKRLGRGKFHFGKTLRDKYHMSGRIRKTTRVLSTGTRKWYKPSDGFRAYLYKDTVDPGVCSNGGPGVSDCFSPETRAAFKTAEEYVFPSE